MPAAFTPRDKLGFYSHNSDAHFGEMSLSVSADAFSLRIGCITDFGSVGIKLTAEQARLLAAELVAAADSLTEQVAA